MLFMIKQSNTIYAFESDVFCNMRGLTLGLNEPTQDPGNPIITPGFNGEVDAAMTQFLATIQPEDNGWRMWYSGRSNDCKLNPCTAWSDDGISWKPQGVLQGVPGSSEIVNIYKEDGVYYMPVKDIFSLRPEHAVSSHVKNLIADEMRSLDTSGTPGVSGLATSVDGLNFKFHKKSTPLLPIKFEVPRIYKHKNKYFMSGQTGGAFMKMPNARITVFATSEDMEKWNLENTVFINNSHDTQTHCGITPIKQIDDRLLIGLGGRFDDASEIIDQHFEITLLYSYDGINWNPVVPEMSHRSWIRRGRRGDWDFGGVEQGDGLIEIGEKAYIYYGGSGVGNIPTPRYWLPGTGAIGRSVFTKDRFAYLTPKIGWEGVFVKSFCKSGRLDFELIEPRAVYLNVEIPPKGCAAGSYVRVSIFDCQNILISEKTIIQGGSSVVVPFGFSDLKRCCKVCVELNCTGHLDCAPRLYAVYYE
jgi:hypothetical protein